MQNIHAKVLNILYIYSLCNYITNYQYIISCIYIIFKSYTIHYKYKTQPKQRQILV